MYDVSSIIVTFVLNVKQQNIKCIEVSTWTTFNGDPPFYSGLMNF